MRSVFLFAVILLLCSFSRAQFPVYADKLIEYSPAPGQHINHPATGTPSVALNIVNGIGNPLSLGAYGGTVVVGFNSPIENHPDNPYGVDFIIYGNASAIHAEAGIVKVMNDENQNGLPDDTWYEIAGSAHFTNDFTHDYSINYQNPKLPVAADVSWTDGFGNNGKVYKNSFHSQPYYPLAELFQGISGESLSFTGSRIKGNVTTQNGIYVSLPYAFGYADNIPVKNRNFTGMPDNPYTLGIIEGDGGDAIDISWAVDPYGNYVDLQEVSFIMVYTGVNESAGWLGEISTDIRGIVDVSPDKSITGKLKMILPSEIPSKIALYDSLKLSAKVYYNGRPVEDEKIIWESLNPYVLQVSGDLIVTKRTGEAEIRASLVSDPSVLVIIKILVAIPQSLLIDKQTRWVEEGETLVVKYSLIDNTGEIVSSLIPDIIFENEEVAELLGISENQIILKAKTAGKTMVYLHFHNYPLLSDSFEIQIIQGIDPIQINFSLNNENKRILPARNYTINKADVLRFTDRHEPGFNPDKPFISLADAVASVLISEGFGTGGNSFAFRQDEYGGNGLYVWQIGFDWEYQYGWGGSKKGSTYAKTWFAVKNNLVFASGFDTIEVADGDRISLQYIEDNSRSWSFIRIITPKEDITTGEITGFRAEQMDVNPIEGSAYATSGPFPVVHNAVRVDQSVINISESDQFTSNTGEFSLSFSKGGTHEVSVENSEPVIVEVSYPLGIKETEQILIYPNPCDKCLKIKNPNSETAGIRIFSVEGSLRIEREFGSGLSTFELDVSHLDKGIYILELITGGNSYKHRFSKL